jgi:hypothetical protein
MGNSRQIENKNNIINNSSIENGFNKIYSYSNGSLNDLLKNLKNGEIVSFCNAKIFQNETFLIEQVN